MKKRLTAKQIGRMQVEEIFGLTGGELNDTPATFVGAFDECDGHSRIYGPAAEYRFTYSYDGAPEYAAREDFGRPSYEASADILTVIDLSAVYGTPPGILVGADGRIWRKVRTYGNSGERECPFRSWHPDHDDPAGLNGAPDVWKVDRATAQLQAKHEPYRWHGVKRPMGREARCPYCEARIGEEHGYVYLGDCTEVVYAEVGWVRGAHPEDGSCDCEAVDGIEEDGPDQMRLECGFTWISERIDP